MSLLDRLRETLVGPQSLPPGLHAYERRDASGGRVRLHLRVEPDGRGLLLINADLRLPPMRVELDEEKFLRYCGVTTKKAVAA